MTGQPVLENPQLLKARGLVSYHKVLVPLPLRYLIENFKTTTSSVYLYVKYKELNIPISQEVARISIRWHLILFTTQTCSLVINKAKFFI